MKKEKILDIIIITKRINFLGLYYFTNFGCEEYPPFSILLRLEVCFFYKKRANRWGINSTLAESYGNGEVIKSSKKLAQFDYNLQSIQKSFNL
jgi:hypothetical protein